ncbi:MAG: type II secretion system F family protein [Acidobacteriia bacterium]|nr:type II secretion system F family protein [Terriglobia bacterium]
MNLFFLIFRWLVVLIFGILVGFIGYQLYPPLAERFNANVDKYSQWMSNEFSEQRKTVSPRRCRQILIGSMLGLAALGVMIDYTSIMLPLVGLVAGYLIPRTVVKYLRKRRFDRIDAQLVDTLTLMASALRSGLSLPQAVDLVVKEIKPPIAEEFSIVVKETRLGVLLDDALLNMANRLPIEDLKMVITSLVTIRETGGNLTEIFDVISHTIQERKKVENKIKALTAQGMFQGRAIALMPLAVVFMFYMMDPEFVKPLYTTALGWIVILLVAGLVSMGYWMMMQIVKIEV